MLESVAGFHIELTNICTLKCPGCARTQFINKWPQHWKNHNLDIEQAMKFLDIDLTDKQITLCGNYGDPIYHPQVINFVQKFKERNARITIITNGSYKSKEWWEELTQHLTEQDKIIFSIDGLPENLTQYRVNADWNSIKIGIDVTVKSRALTHWKYIPFNYNQENIETAQVLSKNLGIDIFSIMMSDRFDESTNHLKPTTSFIGSRYQSQSDWKNNQLNTVNPKCHNGKEHYISADGYYSSCCYVADHRFYYKTPFGKNKKLYSISEQSLSQVLKQSNTVEFYQNLDKQQACQFNCPG